jgi:hypothetical protein
MSKIIVFTIATNKYFEYWKSMVISADKFLFLHDQITFHVFTNHDKSLLNTELNRVEVVFHKIPDLKWPNATLYRYKYIYEWGINLESDFFIHIDADMLIVPHKSVPISELLGENEVGLVLHPGYWRINFPERIGFYINNFKYFLKDLIIITKYGNLGTWCKNKRSKAFVKRIKRKKYYCGAVWFGKKNAILKLANELQKFTETDLKQNEIPAWNDESYLNHWATNNHFKNFDPSFCFEESYKNLEYLNPVIIALDKNRL